uniref:Dipeptidase n=1 Tax=Sus scrofa TaxID=9823 RepID=A0A8D0YBQ8_PIG
TLLRLWPVQSLASLGGYRDPALPIREDAGLIPGITHFPRLLLTFFGVQHRGPGARAHTHTHTHTHIPTLLGGVTGARVCSGYCCCDSPKLSGMKPPLYRLPARQPSSHFYPIKFACLSVNTGVQVSFRGGRVACFLAAPAAYQIPDPLCRLRAGFHHGAAEMNLTRNHWSPWRLSWWLSVGTDGAVSLGLRLSGRAVTKALDRALSTMDLQKVSAATQRGAWALTQAPVVFRHSSAWYPAGRPPPPRSLQLAQRDGKLTITRLPVSFCSVSAAAKSSRLADIKDRVRRVARAAPVAYGGSQSRQSRVPLPMQRPSPVPSSAASLLHRSWGAGYRGPQTARSLRVGALSEGRTHAQQPGRTPEPAGVLEAVCPAERGSSHLPSRRHLPPGSTLASLIPLLPGSLP